jgi:CRISPR-associated protein Csd1
LSLNDPIQTKGTDGQTLAVLERVQENCIRGSTRQSGPVLRAASSSPVSVFSQLLKLKNHHLAKLENKGLVTFFEKEIGES